MATSSSTNDFEAQAAAVMAELDAVADQGLLSVEQFKPATDDSQGDNESGTDPKATPSTTSEADEQTQDADGDDASDASRTPTSRKERNALRAARHDARQAQLEAQRLRAELAEARKATPAPRSKADELLEKYGEDLPDVAEVIKELKAEVEQTKGTKPAAAEEPEFIAPVLPAEVQAVVDENDTLADWQFDPDRTMWDLAVNADNLLRNSPRWKDSPLSERLAEAVRIATEMAPKPTAAAPNRSAKERAQKAIEEAPRYGAPSIGGLRGGTAPKSSAQSFQGMTDEQIIASM